MLPSHSIHPSPSSLPPTTERSILTKGETPRVVLCKSTFTTTTPLDVAHPVVPTHHRVSLHDDNTYQRRGIHLRSGLKHSSYCEIDIRPLRARLVHHDPNKQSKTRNKTSSSYTSSTPSPAASPGTLLAPMEACSAISRHFSQNALDRPLAAPVAQPAFPRLG